MPKPIYFKGLNGIRAIAALIVVIWHTDQFSSNFHLEKIGFYMNGMSRQAVDIFFVLSGFLITYLLLVEKEKTNTINIKKFYLRRIYRIWPLYYLTIVLALFFLFFGIGPVSSDLPLSISLYTFMLANIAYILKCQIFTITPLWSLGVEEQFYLFWPHIIKRTKNYFKVLLLIFFGFLALKLFVYITLTPKSIAYKFLIINRFHIMSIGAIGSCLLYFNKTAILNVIFNKYVQILCWLILIFSITYQPIHLFSFIDKEVNAIIYLIIILNVSSNEQSIISLENKVMNFIGVISYGIYVYHMFVFYLLAEILDQIHYQITHIQLFIAIPLITIIISWISYNLFEKQFLKLKHKHSIIDSSNKFTSP